MNFFTIASVWSSPPFQKACVSADDALHIYQESIKPLPLLEIPNIMSHTNNVCSAHRCKIDQFSETEFPLVPYSSGTKP